MKIITIYGCLDDNKITTNFGGIFLLSSGGYNKQFGWYQLEKLGNSNKYRLLNFIYK